MVSLPVLALIFSVIAMVFAAVAVVVVVDVRARVQTYESARRGELEGQTSEGTSGSLARDGPGTTRSSFPGDQSVSGGFCSVPETPPTAIAPGLQTPPRIKGGFGSPAKDASQLPPDDQASQGEQNRDNSSPESGSG